MNGKLYLVATPIGNLEDITLRAIKTLKLVDIIAAEDTRHTLKLLNHLNISKTLISYYKYNEKIRIEIIIGILKSGQNVALVSDAGTPAISDPGEKMIKAAIEEDIEIVPIPGSCALIAGIIAAGLSTKEFSFFGFLPVDKKLRKEKLEELKLKKETLILYEAPHKILNTLKDLYKYLGDREVVLCRELTKIHEEYIRGKLSSISDNLINIKGEFVIVIDGNKNFENDLSNKTVLNNMSLENHFKFYKNTRVK